AALLELRAEHVISLPICSVANHMHISDPMATTSPERRARDARGRRRGARRVALRTRGPRRCGQGRQLEAIVRRSSKISKATSCRSRTKWKYTPDANGEQGTWSVIARSGVHWIAAFGSDATLLLRHFYSTRNTFSGSTVSRRAPR